MDSANYGTEDDDNNMRNEDVFEERDDHDEHEDDDQEEESQLPGFRFYPTDEELVDFYLKRKVENKPFTLDLIKEIDIYKYDPWSLPKSSTVGDNEWYFFCKRGRKYRNSVRPNRVTGSGFWKATGIDKPIRSSNNIIVGLKKSLVYYIGNAGKGTKTDWMMHEFRLPGPQDFITHNSPPAAVTILNDTDTTQEAEVWTVCRIFKRNVPSRKYTSNWREISTKRSHSSNANSTGSMSANDVFGGINNDSSEQGCSSGSTRNKSIMKSESFISFGNNDIIQNPNYTLNISSQQADVRLTTPFPNEFLGHEQYGSTSNYNQPMPRKQIPTPADYQQPGSSSFYPRQLSSVYSPMDISSNQGNSNNDDDQLRPGTTTQESWDELRQFWSSFQDQHDH